MVTYNVENLSSNEWLLTFFSAYRAIILYPVIGYGKRVNLIDFQNLVMHTLPFMLYQEYRVTCWLR